MSELYRLYRHSMALLTDLYQLTMAYGYWKTGRALDQAVFHLFFRCPPFGGGFTIACGLPHVVQYLEDVHFDAEDVAYLAALKGNDEQPLFEAGFLELLGQMRLSCDVEAVPEGTVVFPHEPLVRVRGPLIQCQLLETFLLNAINFPTLIATKAARICLAARGEAVLEFGLRRAQGIDGALTASRAAYIGGCAATSNVLAGKLFGIPVKGTHAHSWVMAFPSELEAFEAYAAAMPNNCVFLVDTYDTIQGVRHAIEIGRRLRQRGHELAGIRLDSGDLAELSIRARELLDQHGFSRAAIVASNDLDEHLITQLKQDGATISVWGVGTKLATAYDQPALGGVYKLSAIRRDGDSSWQYKLKLSEQAVKTSNPGMLQVRRYCRDQQFCGDMIYNELETADPAPEMIYVTDETRRHRLRSTDRGEDLLIPVCSGGRSIYQPPPPEAARARAQQQLAALEPGVRQLAGAGNYPVGLESNLYQLKTALIRQAQGQQR